MSQSNSPSFSDSPDSPLMHELHNRWPEAQTLEDVQANLSSVYARIAAACQRAGRDSKSVRLLPVSKTKTEASVRLAYAAGCRNFGENKVQEAHQKWYAMRDLGDLQWSIIGHLQSNKAKTLASFATEFHALDSLRVAQALEERLQAQGRSLDVYVQVNTSGEASKYGLQPAEVERFIAQVKAFPALRLRGLMTLAIFSDDVERVRRCFTQLRTLRDEIRQQSNDPESFNELSMGMSGDFEVAIEEGATVVRVGQAIFGKRNTPENFYWPTERT